MKKVRLLIVFTLAAALLLTGCATSQPSGGGAASSGDEAPSGGEAQNNSDGFVIAWSPLYLGNSHQVQSWANAQEFAENSPDIKEVILANPDSSAEEQVNLIRNLIDKGVDAIVIQANSPTALVPVLEEAMDAGIVVINQDSLVDSDNVTCKVFVDDTEWSAKAGQWLVDQLGGQGKIVALHGIAGNTTSRDRWENASKIFNDTPGIEVLAEQNCDWAQAQAQTAIASWLSAYPQIDGVWSQGGEMTYGAILEFQKAGRPMVPMVGEAYNGFLKIWSENKANGFSSIAPALPNYNIQISMELAVRALKGESIPKVCHVPLPMVTDDTVEQYYQPDKPDDYWVFDKLTPEEISEIIEANK